jgi:hypothetical protein
MTVSAVFYHAFFVFLFGVVGHPPNHRVIANASVSFWNGAGGSFFCDGVLSDENQKLTTKRRSHWHPDSLHLSVLALSQIL